jgi:O-antigen/teichoic acid export membrane protein
MILDGGPEAASMAMTESSARPLREVVVAWTAIWGIAYQINTALVQFIGLAFLIRLVGRDQFGLWMTIYAVTTCAPLLAFGQANVVITGIGGAGLVNPGEARRVLTSGLIVSGAVAGLCLLLIAALLPFAPWDQWLNIRDQATSAQATPTAIISLSIAVLAVPLTLVNYALIASRRGVLSYGVMILAQWLGLGVLLIEIATRQPLWLLGATLVAPLLAAGAILSLIGFSRGYIQPPSPASVDGTSIRTAVHFGTTLFFLDLANLSLQRTPELIVVRLRGLGEVASLGAVNRLSLFLLAILQAILLATWPMLSEAAAKHDWIWVRRALLGSLGAIIAVWAAGAVAIWFGGPIFIDNWTGIPGLVTPQLFLAAILFSLSVGLQNWVFTALNALSLYRAQLMALAPAAALYFALALILGRSNGAVGVVLAQSVALLLIAVPAGLVAIRRRMPLKNPIESRDDA